jgi:hypothetical protein
MADSEAVRSRRKRMHKAGDHSLCRRCAAVRGEAEPLRGIVQLPQLPAGPPLDPAAEMRELAARLAEAHRADPANSLLARELRMTLTELMPKGKPEQDADLTGLFGALQA